MPTCEICGRNIVSKAYLIRMGRAEYIACKACAERHGKIVRVIELGRSVKKTTVKKYIPRSTTEVEVVEDYAERVRRAREELGYTRELLARLIGERESTIRRIENGTFTPPLDLARRLEKVLKIKLIEEVNEEPLEDNRGRLELTLGDIVNFKEE